MRVMTCIVCPRGCHLEVGEAGDGFPVTGNGCMRGELYAQEEMTSPARTVTATVRVAPNPGVEGHGSAPRDDSLPRRVPVRTAGTVPKELVLQLARELASMSVTLPVRAGDVVVKDWNGTGVAIVVTRDIG